MTSVTSCTTANGVYMMDAPPPYPGVDPNLTPYGAPPAGFAAAAPPPQQPMSSAGSYAYMSL